MSATVFLFPGLPLLRQTYSQHTFRALIILPVVTVPAQRLGRIDACDLNRAVLANCGKVHRHNDVVGAPLHIGRNIGCLTGLDHGIFYRQGQDLFRRCRCRALSAPTTAANDSSIASTSSSDVPRLMMFFMAVFLLYACSYFPSAYFGFPSFASILQYPHSESTPLIVAVHNLTSRSCPRRTKLILWISNICRILQNSQRIDGVYFAFASLRRRGCSSALRRRCSRPSPCPVAAFTLMMRTTALVWFCG